MPAFPASVLGHAEPFARAVADSTATPVDLAAVAVLAVVSALIGGAVVVEVDSSWHEPVNLYLAGIAGSGEAKTPVLAKVSAPLHAVERDRQHRARPGIAEARTRKRMAEKRRDDSERAAAKAKADDRCMAEALAVDDARVAENIMVPALPRLTTKDATPEGLLRVLSEQYGRLAVVSDEGGDFFELASRYAKNGKANLGVYLSGHDGQPYTVDRAGKDEPTVIDRVNLTVLLFAQPVVLGNLGADRQAHGRGLLARFLWLVPATNVGYRPVDRPPIPAVVTQSWENTVASLAAEAEKVTEPVALGLDPAAKVRFRDWRAANERRLRPEGDLAGARDWGSKLPGQTLRLAANLHVLTCGRFASTISDQTMTSAIALAEYFVRHAGAAFGRMGADDSTLDAGKVLEWLRGRPELTAVTSRGLGRSKDWSADKVHEALGVLERYGWLRPVERTSGDQGGRPSDRWEVHPAIRPTEPDATPPLGSSVGFCQDVPPADAPPPHDDEDFARFVADDEPPEFPPDDFWTELLDRDEFAS